MMKVLAFPKSRYGLNPNILNLYYHLEKKTNIKITEFRFYKPFIGNYDLFHLHWPDFFFVKSFFKTIFRVIYFIIIILWLKLMKTKFVWTVHNLVPHKNYHPKLNFIIVYIWSYFVDGFVVMSDESHCLITRKFPLLLKKKSSLIYHGLYDNYPNNVTKEDARKFLGIDLNAKVILHFGTITEYKNVPILLDQFKKLDCNNLYLLIAGNVKCDRLKETIIKKCSKNVILKLNFISENETQYYYNSSDVVIIASDKLLNSGSAMLALSFYKPLICPDVGSLKELKSIIGERTIITYKQLNLIEHLNSTNLFRPPDSSTLKLFNNKELSDKLYLFYKDIIKD